MSRILPQIELTDTSCFEYFVKVNKKYRRALLREARPIQPGLLEALRHHEALYRVMIQLIRSQYAVLWPSHLAKYMLAALRNS